MQGLCLTKNQKPPLYIVSLVDWLWARVVAFVLWPLHILAEKLVHKKIRSSIGITKVVLQYSSSFSVTCFIFVGKEKFSYLTRKIVRLTCNLFFVSSRLVLVEAVVYLCMLTSSSRLDRQFCFMKLEINGSFCIQTR